MDFSTDQSSCDLCGLRLLDLILHPVTAAFDNHRLGVVQEPVQHGAGQGAVVVEDLGLYSHWSS